MAARIRRLPTDTLDFDIDWGGGFELPEIYCIESNQAIRCGLNPPDSTGVAYEETPLLVDLTIGNTRFNLTNHGSYSYEVHSIARALPDNPSSDAWTNSVLLVVPTSERSRDFVMAVPEPATLGILSLGLLAMVCRRRRQTI